MFKDFVKAIQKNLQQMSKDSSRLFTVNVDTEELYNLYLDSFPAGTNEIYRERREYDCSCCRHFIRDVGNVVSIKNGELHTIIFEAATRYKYRFPFKGMISVEDLWDLKLQDLDSVFKLLNKEKKQSDEESLLQVKSEADQALENKIQIVKFVVQVKQAEAAERLAAKDKKERNQKIMRIIERKQNEALEGKSLEELTAMLEE